MNRTEIRPIIKGLDLKTPNSVEEKFQNETLRPIIKMQNDLLVKYFSDYLLSKKCRFNNLSELKQAEFITAAFKKDSSFKSELKGMIIGQFTVLEFTIYCSNKNDFNKRILAMIHQRITSVISLF
ncbi:MAG: glyoxalase [Vicingaceae bacterium]|nr:glyoxalase [Vicingaceae bacterium]